MPARASNGFGIIEFTISLAISVMVLLGTVSVQRHAGLVHRSGEQENDATLLQAEIFKHLKDANICKASFGNPANPFPIADLGSGIYSNPIQIFKKDLVTIGFQVNGTYKKGEAHVDGRIQIQRFELGDFEQDILTSPGAGKAKLRIFMQKVGETLGVNPMMRIIRLQVNRDPVAPNNILNCVAVGGDADVWLRNADGSIYYNDLNGNNISGNMAIGTNVTDEVVHVVTEGSGDQCVQVSAYNNDPTAGPYFTVAKADGTYAAKIPPAINDEMNALWGRAWNGTSFASSIYMPAQIDGAVNIDQVPGRIEFWVGGGGGYNKTMFIKSDGKVGLGLANPSEALDVVGNIRASDCWQVSGGGFAGVCTSDRRLKTNIRPFSIGLDALMGFKPKTFRYNGLGGHAKSTRDEVGLIAQDLEKSAPELVVNTEASPELKKINYTSLIYVAINAIKEFRTKILRNSERLDEEIQGLKVKLQETKRQNSEIRDRMCQIDPTSPPCRMSK